MHIVVCVKQVHDPEVAPALFTINEATNAVVSVAGLAQVISPYDEQAIEAALRIKDKKPDTKITVLTVGAASAREVLKHGLSMGADEAVLVNISAGVLLDSHATTKVLHEAVNKIGAFDLIFTGRQSADFDAGVVGNGLAELLRIPAITFAKGIEVADSKVVVDRVLDNGSEKIETTLPALVTVSNEIGAARKPNLRETMRASRKPTQSWTQADLSKGPMEAAEELIKLFIPKKEKHCEFLGGASAAEQASSLVRKLRDARLI